MLKINLPLKSNNLGMSKLTLVFLLLLMSWNFLVGEVYQVEMVRCLERSRGPRPVLPRC